MEISPGTVLYRAAKTIEEHPTPRLCGDTLKEGVYFSAFNPYLSETMCIEYNEDLMVAVYVVVEVIDNIDNGKYAFTHDYTGRYADRIWDYVPPEDNHSHIDFGVKAVSDSVCEYDGYCAELFLTENDLSKIRYVKAYPMTLEECKKKWCV